MQLHQYTEIHCTAAFCVARDKGGFMIIDQRNTNAVIQALCNRGLQGKSQKIFLNASLPEVDTDDIQRKIAELQEDLTAFARDIACIEQDYKDKAVENEQKKIVRADLAEDLYNSYNGKFGREEAARIIDHIILKMKSEIADGNTIELRGFGTLYAKKRNGRKNARNPKTGEIKNIPPHYVAAFKAGQELKQSLLILDALD